VSIKRAAIIHSIVSALAVLPSIGLAIGIPHTAMGLGIHLVQLRSERGTHYGWTDSQDDIR
jgi:hypothetical protein